MESRLDAHIQCPPSKHGNPVSPSPPAHGKPTQLVRGPPKPGPSPDRPASPHLARLVELLLQPRHRHAACCCQTSRSNSGFRRRRRTDFVPPRAGRRRHHQINLPALRPRPGATSARERARAAEIVRGGRTLPVTPPYPPHPTLQRHPRALGLSACARPLQAGESIAREE